jgi:hypothetical protein
VRVELAERVEELELAGAIDPKRELLALVSRLITASREQPANTAVARELRACLAALPRAEQADPVSALQAKVAARESAIRAGVAEVIPLPPYLRGGKPIDGADYWSGPDRRSGDGRTTR